ncbi:DUF1289 domain-containing protein [Colwellia sp. 20A7]|jgi:predicted Fe-S protein YdhL (DUF1289 family)|uniref:DUF1289 domain-containing protein n=1 Tax=Colwellia sp. 20A7 TaxID=2689569 RepID=UPI0019154D81|nr:DUF1289 domain-containing protein [Colwellia sp. 20A7]
MIMVNKNNIITPCVGQCGLDENDICIGCCRSKMEITGWMNKSNAEKTAIVIRCKKNMALNRQNR